MTAEISESKAMRLRCMSCHVLSEEILELFFGLFIFKNKFFDLKILLMLMKIAKVLFPVKYLLELKILLMGFLGLHSVLLICLNLSLKDEKALPKSASP